MNKNFTPVKTVLAAFVGMALTASVLAADMMMKDGSMSQSQYKEMEKSTKAEYHSALKACGTTRGAERTLCRKDARTARNAAMSDARAKRGPMTGAADPQAGGSAISANETPGPNGMNAKAKNRNIGSAMDRSSGIVGNPAGIPKNANETAGPNGTTMGAGNRNMGAPMQRNGAMGSETMGSGPKSANETPGPK